MIVPQGAVQTLEDQTVVFVSGDEAGTYHARPVNTGRQSGAQVEIVSGLEAGAPVVVEGAFILKSEVIRGQLGHGHAH